jgi:VWFA-related protein
MRSTCHRSHRLSLRAILCLLICAHLINAQIPTPSSGQGQAEVLRVYTDIVQTDVMVFDRSGKFVNGLKKEDFELRIDGKTRPIEFFERVTAGSVSEESQLAAARGATRANSINANGTVPLDRGRPVYFYVDDFHLNLPGLKSAQKLIIEFIDHQMGQNDEAAIVAASGQVGFLAQLTDNKTVLRAALDRLKVRSSSTRDLASPPMTEYQALLISNYDRDVTDYFIDMTIASTPGLTRDQAESIVRSRAQGLVSMAGNITAHTLSGLEGLVKAVDKLPGRKLVFFISDGFFLDDRNSDSMARVRRIASAAARNGVVIYSLDSRGLVASMGDASSGGTFDPSGRLVRSTMGELTASQQGLNALARDTGGKAFFNSNSMEPALTRAMEESASYYLLAWRPDRESQRSSKFRRIDVKIASRPELSVQVRRGFFDMEPEPNISKSKKEKPPNPETNISATELRKVLSLPYPGRDLPISLRLSYLNTKEKGDVLMAAMQVPTQFLSFDRGAERATTKVGIAGSIYDDKGNSGASFSKQVSLSATNLEDATGDENLVYGHSVYLKPGLYHVRVGARDDKSGRAGSAHAWIDIPNIASGKLALSSLFIGVRGQNPISNASASDELSDGIEVRIAPQFSPNDSMRFIVWVYNATASPSDAKPDVAVQVQVVRDSQPVVTAPLKKVSLEGIDDLKRIPYAAQVSLAGLPAGRYVLQVSFLDRIAKTSATQQARFEIH